MYFDSDTVDWVGARRIINGSDKANLIASYAKTFYRYLDYTEEKKKSDEDTGIINIQNPDKSLVTLEAENPVKAELEGKTIKS